jgi:predicted nucleic acid-binding protein
MIVISNATPLIALGVTGQIDLLPKLFAEILVPPAIYSEVVERGQGRPGTSDLSRATWLRVIGVRSSATIEPLLLGLDAGEIEVLLLAREITPDWVLLDERLARRVAHAMHLPVKGTLGILLAAFHAGLLDQQQTLAAAQRMIQEGIRLSPALLTWLQMEVQ